MQPPSESEERLLEIIAELKNDLRIRDEEYTEQQESFIDVQSQNEMLREQLAEES